MSSRRILFLTCYAASGAAALIYQVVWVRLFGLTLGHSVASSSIVLAAFMCGLAAGAATAGRLRPTPDRALAWYAALEGAVALAAISVPLALQFLEPLLAWAYADGEAPATFVFVRAGISFVLLGLPAAAMGATFPLAVSYFTGAGREDGSHRDDESGGWAGRLYAINTAGAAAGATAAGFWLLPALGMRSTTGVAAGLNVAAAACALWLLRSGKHLPQAVNRPLRRTRRDPALDAVPRFVPLGAVALSGFAALVFEVGWARLIALIIGPTTYAFAIMAASFIVGIACGSAMGVGFARSPSRRLSWLGAMLLTSGVGMLVAAWFTAFQLPLLISADLQEFDEFTPILLRQAVLIGALLLAASAAFGATFTIALAIAATGAGSAADESARVYAANTVGAVTGALAAGFVLLPALGLESTFRHTSGLLVAAAAILVFTYDARRLGGLRRFLLPGVATVLLIVTMMLPGWNRMLLASGWYKYARGVDLETLAITARAGHLEYYREGPAGTVSVKSLGGIRSLALDGKVDASNGGDMLTQRLLGVLPTFLHPDPRSALVIGLGSGVTADAVRGARTVDRLDVVEISPAVIEAAALFEGENRRVLHDPGVRLLVGDGRTHLQLSQRRYDVIVSEPSNPWMAGVAALFTREFFDAVRRRLEPGGVFCQWTHTYELTRQDLVSIVRTFASVFPDGTIWLVGDGDLLLIGGGAELGRFQKGPGDRSRDVTTLEPGLPRASIPFFLASLYVGTVSELLAGTPGDAVQSDDRMDLEFAAARAMYAPPEGNAPWLLELRTRAIRPPALQSTWTNGGPEDWMLRGRMALRADAFEMAHESFRRAAMMDGRSTDALVGAVQAASPLGGLEDEMRWLRRQAAISGDNHAPWVALSSALALTGQLEAAADAAVEAVRLGPDSPEPLEQLASVLADMGDGSRLSAAARRLVAAFPERTDSRYYLAASLFMTNRLGEAREEIARLLASHPAHAKGHNLHGILCATAGERPCAQRAFETALTLDPRDASAYVNLANAHLEAGNRAEARRILTEAIAIDPAGDRARAMLRAIPEP